MDLFENAFQEEQNHINYLVEKARNELNKNKLHPTGECLNCGEKVNVKQLFCHNFCADEFYKYNDR